MRLCSVKNLTTEMVLGKSIYQNTTQLLLSAGFRITPAVKAKLTERGYTHVYIMEEGTDDIIPQDIISDEVKLQANSKLTDKVERIKAKLQFEEFSLQSAHKLLENGYLKDINLTYDIKKVIDEILKDIADAGSKIMNTLMVKSADNYFVDHALNTTTLAIIIGKKFHFSKQELSTLALGTFLHDIGKVIIDQVMKNKKGSNSEDLSREHPTFGYLILKNDPTISPMETQIVNQHHENQDGSGFPIGLKGQNLLPIKTVTRDTKGTIFRLAEICSVVNTYDNMVLNPLDQTQVPPHEVIKKIMMMSGNILNKEIVQVLCTVVPSFPVGTFIKVMDIIDPTLIGCYGVVAKINEDNINRPVIILTTNKFNKKMKPVMIDTSKLKHIELKLIV